MEIKRFKLYVGPQRAVQTIMLIGERVKDDSKGRPVHMMQVMLYSEKDGYGYDYSPELPGRPVRKDGKFRMVGDFKSIGHLMEELRNEMQAYLDSDEI